MFFRYAIIAITFIIACQAKTSGQIKVPSFVSDGMVLQRYAKVNIWGKASPREKNIVPFHNKAYAAQTGNDSSWRVKLDAAPAGGLFEMVLKASNTISIKNVMLYDVWLCGGQSNMAMELKNKYAGGVDYTPNPMIRQLRIDKGYNFNADTQIGSSGWMEFNKENAPQYSAVAYWFGQMVFDKYHVAIGLINSTVGGTPAQAWVSEDALKQFPNYQQLLKAIKDTLSLKNYMGAILRITSTPASLYNNMIARLVGYTLQGVIFYQGEANANTGKAAEYYRLFPALINDWSTKRQQPNLPFIYVQLANFNPPQAKQFPGARAELRDAQRLAPKVNVNMVIKDNKMIVLSDAITNPVAIRYAWDNNPIDADLFNKEVSRHQASGRMTGQCHGTICCRMLSITSKITIRKLKFDNLN